MEASAYLSCMGVDVTLLEKADRLGGHLRNWEKLFPTLRMGSEVLNFLSQGISSKITVKTGCEAISAAKVDGKFQVRTSAGEDLVADALLIATGYETFDARKKEEYGYGIYDNVMTSAELESVFLSGKPLFTHAGKVPGRVAFIHCVGSRDARAGNDYCSKVCCVTAVKQSIEIRKRLPHCEAFCFYMDLRMYGTHFEELYNEALEKWGVSFIRGRLSEAAENQDGSLLIKVEDTLAGRPLRMSVDVLVLMVGFVPSEGTTRIGKSLGLEFGPNKFIKPSDEHIMNNMSSMQGVFIAGTASAPRTITNTIIDSRAAAATVLSYLNRFPIESRSIV